MNDAPRFLSQFVAICPSGPFQTKIKVTRTPIKSIAYGDCVLSGVVPGCPQNPMGFYGTFRSKPLPTGKCHISQRICATEVTPPALWGSMGLSAAEGAS